MQEESRCSSTLIDKVNDAAIDFEFHDVDSFFYWVGGLVGPMNWVCAQVGSEFNCFSVFRN
jgi:hypothetical protein